MKGSEGTRGSNRKRRRGGLGVEQGGKLIRKVNKRGQQEGKVKW